MAAIFQAQESAPPDAAAPASLQDFGARLEGAVHTVLQVHAVSSDYNPPKG